VPNKDPDGSDNPEGRVQSWRIRIKQPPAAFFTPDRSKCRNTLALAPSFEAYKSLRAALHGFPTTPNMTQLFPRIRCVAAAITISPRMIAVLAAAWHFAERPNAPLFVIHGGASDALKEAEFRDAMFQLEMPPETRIVWSEGEPAGAIVAAAEKEGVDLLIAGALEGKEVASRSFLGAVARPLAKLASALFAVTFDASQGRSESISQDRGDDRFL
jgi:nucleotide-binding universal stress UspA family protein